MNGQPIMITNKIISFYEKKRKIISYIFVILLAISLIPVCALGFFNHASGDDYYYGYYAALTYRETGNIFSMITTAIRGVIEQYNIWQGTYSAMFFMYLPPMVFNIFFYRIYATVLILCLVFSIFYLLKPIIIEYLTADRYELFTIASIVSFLWVQTIPNAGEGLYWFNGSMYYTGFFACTLFFWGLILRYVLNPSLVKIIVLCLLGLFISGGNYVSLLPSLIALFLTTLFQFLIKKNTQKGLGLSSVFLFSLFGFIVSAIAPGNKIRAAESYGMSAIKAIIKSLLNGLFYIKVWSKISVILFAFILIPIFIYMIKKTKFTFKYPLLVLALIYGIFCSMSCPTFYGEGTVGHPRCFNLSYFALILMLYSCLFYIMGFFCKRYKNSEKNTLRFLCENIVITASVFMVLVAVILGIIRPYKDTITEPTGVRAAKLILNKEAKQYSLEYNERIKLINNNQNEDIIFSPYSVSDAMYWMLYVGDFSSDSASDNNVAGAAFYGVNSITVE